MMEDVDVRKNPTDLGDSETVSTVIKAIRHG